MNLSEYKTSGSSPIANSKISTAISRLDGIINTVKDLEMQLDKKIIQLLGDYPRDPSIHLNDEQQAAGLFQLDDRITKVAYQLLQLQDKINRIQEV